MMRNFKNFFFLFFLVREQLSLAAMIVDLFKIEAKCLFFYWKEKNVNSQSLIR